MAIYWIDWQFGSWKTNLALFLAENMIDKSNNYLIISNIKIDKNKIPNYHYFDDDKFLETLRSLNAVNDLERFIYSKMNEWWINIHNRDWYTRFYLFFDESWAILNNHIKLENNATYAEYINQNRKNFEDIFIISVKWGQNNKTIRQMVDWWFYVKPLLNFWFLKYIWIIRKQQRDEEGKLEMINYLWKDQNWDYVNKLKPLDFYFSWFWRPKYWRYYDDLHKNIRDPNKYKLMNNQLFLSIIRQNNYLKKLILENEKFDEIKKLIPPEEQKIEEKKEEKPKISFIRKTLWL